MVLALSAYAEHLIEGGLHGGLTYWDATTVYVNHQLDFHGGAHLYYSYLAPHILGIRAGLTLDRHNVAFSMQDYADSYSTIDVNNQQMDISYTISSLRETYSIWSVGLPLQAVLFYRQFSLLVGPKVVFPLVCSWKQTVNHAALSVYYPDYENFIEESYPLAASRDFSMENERRLSLPKVQWWLATEFNYAFTINDWARNYRSYIIVGAYFDYCLTSITAAASNSQSLLMLSDTRDGLPLQRLFTPIIEANRQGQKLVSDGGLFNIGIKISYAIAPFKPHKEAYTTCHCYGN